MGHYRATTKANQGWSVLPHRPIEKLSDHVWRVQGSLPNMALKRVMTIVRRDDGGLVSHYRMIEEDAAGALRKVAADL